jgi:hypothetical protein
LCCYEKLGKLETARPNSPVKHNISIKASVIDRFEEVATFHKSRTALDDGNLRLTYGELAETVNRIACAIHWATKGNDGPVAVLLEQ